MGSVSSSCCGYVRPIFWALLLPHDMNGYEKEAKCVSENALNVSHPLAQYVSKDMTSRYDELSTLMTQDDNYARYRSELGTLAPDVFCVPFIGMRCGSVEAWPGCRPGQSVHGVGLTQLCIWSLLLMCFPPPL
jgi:hypothetical protein